MRILIDPFLPAALGRLRAWTAGACALAGSIFILMAIFGGSLWLPMIAGLLLLGGAGVGVALYSLNVQRYRSLVPHANEMLRKGEVADLLAPMIAAAIEAGAAELRNDHDRAHFNKLAAKAAAHWAAMAERWINPNVAPATTEPDSNDEDAKPARSRSSRFDPRLVDFIREPARTGQDPAAWIAFFRDMNGGALPVEEMRSADRIVRRLRGIFVGAFRAALSDRHIRGAQEFLPLQLAFLASGLRAAGAASPAFGPAAIESGESMIARLSPAQATSHAAIVKAFRAAATLTTDVVQQAKSQPSAEAAEESADEVTLSDVLDRAVADVSDESLADALPDVANAQTPTETDDRIRPAVPLPVAKQASNLSELYRAARRRIEQQAMRRENLVKTLPQFDLSVAVREATEALEGLARGAKAGDARAQEALLANDPAQTASFLRQRRDERLAKLRAMYDEIIDDNARLASVALVNGNLDAARDALAEVVTGRPKDLASLGRLIEVQHLSGQLDDAERLAQRMLELAVNAGDEASEAAANNHFGQVAQAKGELDRAEDFYRTALSIAERIGSRSLVAAGYCLLGQVLSARGDNDRAAEMFRGAMAASESNEGPSRVRATAAGQLGAIYRGRGDLLKAEQMLRIAATAFTECAAPASAALQLNVLGLIYKQRGDLDHAEETYRQAVTLNEQCNCEEGLAVNFGNLSDVVAARGDILGAESLLRRSIDLFEKGNSPDGIAMAYAKLGAALHAKGDLGGAADIFSISQAINEKLGNRERMATDLANLGLVHQSRGELAQAQDALLQALELQEQIGDKRAIASTCNNLGLTCDRLGDRERAERLFVRALGLLEATRDDAELARVHTNLGNLYLARGQVTTAEDHLIKALSLHEDLGLLQGIAANCDGLSEIYKNRGELDQAEEMLRTAMSALAKMDSDCDSGLAVASAKLGAIYRARGDLSAAADLYREAIVLDERRGATNDLAANCGNLGLLYRGMGQLDLAERLLRRALNLYEQLGREDNVAVTYSHLGSLEIERGHTPNAKQLWTQALALYQKLGRQDTARSLRGRLESLSGTGV